MNISSSPRVALVYMIAAHLCFTLMILLVKIGHSFDLAHGFDGTGTWETVFIRSLPMAIIFAFLAWQHHCEFRKNGQKSLLTPSNLQWLALRGIIGTISMFCYFYGTLHIPLAVTSLFANTNVFFIAVLAHFFLHERMTKRKVYFTLAGFMGIVLILAQNLMGSASSKTIIDYMITFMTGALAGVAYFSIRRMKMIPGSYIIASLAIFGVLASLLGMSYFGVNFPDTPRSTSFIWLSALPAILGQWFMTKSFQAAEASYVALGQFTAPVFAALSAFLIFDERLNAVQILGMGMAITFGAALPLLSPIKSHDSLRR